MGIYIYGAGKIGNRLLQELRDRNVKVSGFIDGYKKGNIGDVNILDLTDIEKESTIIIAIQDCVSVVDAYYKIKQTLYAKILWYYGFDGGGQDNTYEAFIEGRCLDITNWGKCVIPHVELHISDKCNLNCRGCTHFSPLFDAFGSSMEERIGYIQKLLTKFSSIARLDILGGEPLLNPELQDYIRKLRALLPNTLMDIYTNGLLIDKLSDETLECIKNNHIPMSISEYKPTHLIINKIIEKLDSKKISYITSGYDAKRTFNRPISISANSKFPKECISEGCYTVDRNAIAKCPTLMYVYKFNEIFKQNLPEDGIYSLDNDMSGKDLLELLEKPVPLCQHCIRSDIEWDICRGIHIEDFAELD